MEDFSASSSNLAHIIMTMTKKTFKEYLGISSASQDAIKRFEILEKLYQRGKLNLDEISQLSELSKEKLARYFQQKEDDTDTKRTVFVAGGAGFIGSNFVRYLHQKYKNYRIINYDKLTYAGNPDNVKDLENSPRYLFIQGDICDEKSVMRIFERHKPDLAINFAAETHVGRSLFLGVKQFVSTNIFGVVNLLEAVRAYKTPRFVHVSTDETYGTLKVNEDRLFNEKSPFLPNVPYAAAKAGGDLMCRSFYQSFKVPVIVTHASNNYGPYQYPEKAIPFWTLQALRQKPLPVHGKGEHVRDWLFVDDHCRALDAVLHRGSIGEVYNVGGQSERTIVDVALGVLKALGKPKTLIHFIEDRPGNDVRYALDITKINKELGWEPSRQFEETLPEVVEWYRTNAWWVENVLKRAKTFNAYVR